MNTRQMVWMMVGVGLCLAAMIGCAAPEKKVVQPTLFPPVGSKPAAVAAMKEGNRLFALNQFAASKVQYESAIQSQPDLAEAHYNLALALDRLGKPQQAREHYIQAANLAPGHKVIWDSPVLRRYGDVPDSSSSSRGAGTPVLPALGGLGSGTGGGLSNPGVGY